MSRDGYRRSLAKAVSWQICGILSTMLLAGLFMEDVQMAGGFALLSAVQGLVFYVLHERLWDRMPFGRGPAG